MTTTTESLPPLPHPLLIAGGGKSWFSADQMHAYIRAERAARQEAQRQLYAERERLYKLVSDEQVKASRLHAEIEALRRGEFVCGKCGLSKDAETSGPTPF